MRNSYHVENDYSIFHVLNWMRFPLTKRVPASRLARARYIIIWPWTVFASAFMVHPGIAEMGLPTRSNRKLLQDSK